jgi:3-oxoacyl-[acyl-carrier protein] reductase
LGADVGVVDINLESFKEFEGEARLLTAANVMEEIAGLGRKSCGVAADVGKLEQVRAAVDSVAAQLGGLDICVAIAGGGMGPTDQNTPSTFNWEQYHGVIDRNLHGTVYTCHSAAPHLKAAGGGKIVTISSIAGLMAQSDGAYAHYGIAKAGIIHLTKYLAQDLARHGINANCVAPGFIATGRLNKIYKEAGEDLFLSRMAIKRFGSPKDVADAVEFLVGPESDYVTGFVLEVTGGVNGRLRMD